MTTDGRTGMLVPPIVERHLDQIEQALRMGDLDLARQHVSSIRRCVTPESESFRTAHADPRGVTLTGQELATLGLLPDGSMSQKDIARSLGVTMNTLKTHLKSLYLKLGVHCRGEAIEVARQIGILPTGVAMVAFPSTIEDSRPDRACA